ncbi:MAG: carboxylating nicotinate-nucleotide diphosphorylase [Alphaproteobacteria bacterium]|nr:carboxylating nicotinate-nucleotide diphosphorylase [Alphaproteobacteria bacterium]
MTRIPPLPSVLVEAAVRAALLEDFGRGGDITSAAVIPENAKARVVMAAREEGVICGLDIAETAFRLADAALDVKKLKQDGDGVKKGDAVMEISGHARAILAAERVALNFAGRLSGIATLTDKMARACGNRKARVCDTRKTTPNLRLFEKYAVRCGGGMNHRFALDDAMLIKDNHIAVAGGVIPALRAAKAAAGHAVKIEIEVDTLGQLKEVLAEGADIALLDNMSLDDMAAAVKMADGKILLEASGNVTLARVPAIAATGVDMISSGALTHSAPNFDLGLDYKSAA